MAAEVQPGERASVPPIALLLVPALRVKVFLLFFTSNSGKLVGLDFTTQFM